MATNQTYLTWQKLLGLQIVLAWLGLLVYLFVSHSSGLYWVTLGYLVCFALGLLRESDRR